MERWDEVREVGSTEDTGNVEYFRALKRTIEARPDSAPVQVYPGEQRRFPRYKCEGSAEFRSEGSTVRTWATVTDLSRSGCYVEMQATFPVDTNVDMMIEVTGIRVQVKGLVRVSYPFLGMGIAFTEIPEVSQGQLDEILVRLASGIGPGSYGANNASSSSACDVSKITDPRGALQAVAAFFREHHTLTREQFSELVVKHGGSAR
jgi:PilZ domain-containing protein